jgi:hypothetical protein
MDHVERLQVNRRLERIGLDKEEWVARLRLDVDSNHVESCSVVSHRSPSSATEEIKQLRSHQFFLAICLARKT